MSSNKRNVDSDELPRPKPSQGTALPSGTGTHDQRRVAAGKAAADPQRRGVEGRKAGPLPPVGLPDDVCVRDPDQLMTEDQAEHLRILCAEAGETFDPALPRDAAERQIRRLQHRAGFKP